MVLKMVNLRVKSCLTNENDHEEVDGRDKNLPRLDIEDQKCLSERIIKRPPPN
jgi:hypothetical protein